MLKAVVALAVAVSAALLSATPAHAGEVDRDADVVWTDAAGAEGVARFHQREAVKSASGASAPEVDGGVSAQAAVWAACGWKDSEEKLVRLFQRDRRRDYALRCGNAGWGYHHIQARHQGDFERLAEGTFQNWRDVADLSMAMNSSDPDVTLPAGGNQTCNSRVIFLVNIRNGQTVRQQIVKMYTDNGNSRINSVFPATHCS
jgi:hypothetical protein